MPHHIFFSGHGLCNLNRIPPDFMFQLTAEEAQILKCQFGISSLGHGGRRRSLPYAFTVQGVAMLPSVLRSERAVQVNVPDPIDLEHHSIRLQFGFTWHAWQRKLRALNKYVIDMNRIAPPFCHGMAPGAILRR